MTLNLSWTKCLGDVWCDFQSLNLNHPLFNNLEGVYIIWSNSTAVRVGSGVIKNRIAEHRRDTKITAYPNLKVIWAQVSSSQMRGVEKYLADVLDPKVGERFPDVIAIPVNWPWK